MDWDGGYATGDGVNYKLAFDSNTVTYSDDAVVQWKNANNAFSGSPDLGFARESAGWLRITNGSSGYGAVDASAYSVSGAPGLTITKTVVGSSGSDCTLTFASGLLTATTCP